MNYTQYHPDMGKAPTDIDQSRQDTQTKVKNSLLERTTQADSSAHADEYPDALQTVANGVQSGASPLQFMGSINAGNQQLGNRTFMQFVGGLHARRQEMDTHGIVAKGLQGSGQLLTHLGTLQQAFGHHDISGMREYTGSETKAALDWLGAGGIYEWWPDGVCGDPGSVYSGTRSGSWGTTGGVGGRFAVEGRDW